MMKKLCIIDANQKENISFAPGEFGNRCRTCFRNNGMINIFSTKYQDVFLNQMFPMFSFPTITVNDGLPQKVCGACAKILFEFYTFKEKVVQLQPLLNVAAKHLNVVKPVNVTKPGQNFKAQDSGILYNILNENDAGGTAVRKQQDPLSVLCETIKIDDEDDDDSFGGNEEEVENIVICNEDDEDIIENDNEGAEGEVVYEEDYVVQDEEMEETYIKEEEIQISDEILEEQMASEEEVVKEEDEKKDVPKVLYCNPTVFKTIAHHIQTQNQDETLHSFQSDSNEVVNEIVVHGNVIPIPDQLKTALESTEFPRIDHPYLRKIDKKLSWNKRQLRKKETRMRRLRNRCKICKKQVETKYMERHRLLHERDTCVDSMLIWDPETGEYRCDVCNGSFENESEYSLHRNYNSSALRQKQNERLVGKLGVAPKYSCNVCDKRYPLRILRDHMNTHTNQKPYMCDLCGEKFSFRSNFMSHYRAHKASGALCEMCGKMFSTHYKLIAHTNLQHLGIIRHGCDLCGKGFLYDYNLRLHMRFHTGEKPHSCPKCGVRFTQRVHLNTHMKEYHANERPYKCDICFRSFAVKYKLNYHMKIHDKQKSKEKFLACNQRTKCQVCNQRCRTTLYTDHVKLHNDGFEFVCSSCNAVVSDNTTLTYHKKYVCSKKTVTLHVCDICDKSFHSKAAVAIHKRCHTGEKPYTCQMCGKQFSQRGHLDTHFKLHTGEKDFECPYCQKRFTLKGNLKQHIMTHTGETSFKCDICYKGFVTASTLRKHQNVHRKKLLCT